MATITELKFEAEKKAKKLGHELKKWKYEWAQHSYFAYCNLCGDYVRVVKGSQIVSGTAIDSRPVRDYGSSDIEYIRYRCSGVMWRAIERRKYTNKKKKIITAFEEGGINKVITEVLGDYSIT